MLTELRMWLSVQLFDLAITVCPFEEMREMFRDSLLRTINDVLGEDG